MRIPELREIEIPAYSAAAGITNTSFAAEQPRRSRRRDVAAKRAFARVSIAAPLDPIPLHS